MAAANFKHTPILKNDAVALFLLKPGMIVIDGTLGGGGHAEAILEKITPGGKLIGIDRDPAAIEAASKRLERFGESFIPVRGNHKDAIEIAQKLGYEGVDGVMLDLGTSSPQLDNPNRGFSYRFNAPLDMRMNPDDKLTAKDIVNTYSEKELANVIFRYGEEKFSRRIAKKIVEARQKQPVETTFELVEIIKDAIPAPARRKGGHPAKRTFQSLRIEVNSEVDGLKETIKDLIGFLNEGGAICVISFHSLEDRAVKWAMKQMQDPCTCPPDIPMCICGKKSQGKMITKKPIMADPEEIERNPRAQSAKMRAFRKQTEK